MTAAARSILVVEDENVVSMDLRASLERLGYTVTACVGTGRQAIDSAESDRPALVLMDIHLRGNMDGIEAADHIRRKLDLPVIYLTAFSDDATLKRAQITEPFGYILKPFDERELHVIIEMALFRHGAQKEHEKLLTEQAARAAVEKERQWLQFLARAGERLSASLDLKVTLQEVAALAVPGLADWAVVHLRDEEGVRPIVVRHVGGREALVWEILRRYPAGAQVPHGYSHVMRTQQPELLPHITDEVLVASALDDEALRLLRTLGLRAQICVPLVVRGEAFGALTLAISDSNRNYGPGDVDHAMELARRCASAIDNARLYEEAQQAVALRDEFLSVASHELRTPLTSLVLALQSIERSLARLGDEKIVTKFARIVQQSGRLTELVERLLDVSRLSAGNLDIEVQETDLAQLVQDVAARFEEEARRAGSVIQVSTPPALIGWWDRVRLEQVLTNLVGNALKFCAGKPVELTVDERGGRVILAVRDQGIGIPKATISRLFERFGRGVSMRNYGGLGLGLYVTRQLVETHGGRIQVESQPGERTSFVVDLPRDSRKSR